MKIFRVLSKISEMFPFFELIGEHIESILEYLKSKDKQDLKDLRNQNQVLKDRITMYRRSFVNGEDLRENFINEFPANFNLL